jgi:hypothetical protein
MARYFFHLTGRVPVEDDEGEEFPTPEAAVAAAHQTARELAHNRSPCEPIGRDLRVTDETGAEIVRVVISDYRNALAS